MITIFVEENNPLTPDFYNSFIFNLQFHRLCCSCGHAGGLSVHGYYNRYIKQGSEKPCFRICRVICKHCRKTHALLLSSMVPYSQLSLDDHIDIIKACESEKPTADALNHNPTLDESTLRHVITRYRKHWKQRLLSFHIPLQPLSLLTALCFSLFSRQFMQIKPTVNYLFLNTT